MRAIILIVLLFTSGLIFSQTGSARERLTSVVSNSLASGGSLIFNDPNELKGDIHVFPKWNNTGVIRVDNKDYRLGNLNFNIKTDNFESKVGKDSIFIFDTSNIEHVYINNRKFKSFYFSRKGSNKNFEVIYGGDDFELLKGYEIGIRYGEPDPLMVKKTVDTYFATKTYYIRTGTEMQEIDLKKKAILAIFKGKSKSVGAFAKENKLSYKKDKDLRKIFNYYDSL